ncbi:Por secretion system C-terminal sorting domain-containing protein [Tangfeifania diversioriginum]|uniref:Por secretion system C-terminal sorting domain-containing protein n=1 Tax=Tangfeifania diversioriginum TaxID=1168035 RepID=A0A1M6GTC0_9BACT|nr:T9SS type A sorting domain-containing protein [Tangfeifania diversioriginum]SHJ13160.1 Por secretion system C-terminal sorting domain-containing protein [Tangfeifania diversioriginum]
MFDVLINEYPAPERVIGRVIRNGIILKIGKHNLFISVLFLFFFAVSANATTYYLSPTGNDTTGDGSISSPWFTLNKAWKVVTAGDTIYLRGGTYEFNSRQTLFGKNGNSGNFIHIFAYPDETPVLTKSGSFVTPSWPITLLYVQGDYTRWKGIEIYGFSQATNEIWSAFRFTNSNNNILEQINSHHNGHGGIITGNSTKNLIINCDFHHNYDPLTTDAYGNGDGLEFPYINYGTDNTVMGCRFYLNSDDGIDLWENDGYVTIENCWSWMNGYREDGVTPGGNGEGIKLGKTTTRYSSEFLRKVRNNLSFYNRNDGISQNAANCKIYYYNNTLYANGYRGLEWFIYASANVVQNNISLGNENSNYSGEITNATINNNTYHATWQPKGPVATSDDFVSIDTTGVSGPRQADGSLPDIDFLKLKSSSDLIDAGIDVGIDYNGTAPDLGAFEFQAAVAKEYTTEKISICEGESYEGWTVSGEYERILTASSGADSIVTTSLTVNPIYDVTENITIFEGENYQGWTESGQYKRTLTSVSGCDSIATTNLTLALTKNTTENISICEGTSYEGWTTPNKYERILTAASGADSIVTTNLTVNPTYDVTENITILEGENYQGWTESGQYKRTLTSVSGCDSIVTTNLTLALTKNTTENISICEGTSYEGWTTPGKYERILTAASGADSIVTTYLTVNPTYDVTENITIFEGESYRGWTESGQYERTLTSVTGCDSIVTTYLKIKQALPTLTQSIQLDKGWNIFSSYLNPPNSNMEHLLESLQKQNQLIEVQDENGNTYQKNENGWENNIGEIKISEGYKIRVTNSSMLQIQGDSILLPLNIELKTGWNIISFPYNGSVDAMWFLQPIINNGILEKVQDEKGNSIENWGTSIGWINGIGNFTAGEGYLVQVNKNGLLPILHNYEKSAGLLADEPETNYFHADYEGNGFGHMNVNITGLNETNLQVGDEIAAFDGDICVGAVKLSETNLISNVVSIRTSAADKNKTNGFIEGNSIQLRIWDTVKDEVNSCVTKVMNGELVYQKQGSVFVRIEEKKKYEMNDSNTLKVNMYPNPASNIITIHFSTLPEKGTRIELTDMTGKQLIIREAQSNQEILNIQEQPAGMYLVKIIAGKNYQVNKLIKTESP